MRQQCGYAKNFFWARKLDQLVDKSVEHFDRLSSLSRFVSIMQFLALSASLDHRGIGRDFKTVDVYTSLRRANFSLIPDTKSDIVDNRQPAIRRTRDALHNDCRQIARMTPDRNGVFIGTQ